MITEQPDAIIITISQQMLKEKGVSVWARNFFGAMAEEDWTYWFRQGNRPKHDVMWVYILIAGRIRYRVNFVSSHPKGYMTFSDGSQELYGNAWVCVAGPLIYADEKIYRKGFQGFRYTRKLF